MNRLSERTRLVLNAKCGRLSSTASLSVACESAFARLALVMSCAGPADLTPRRGLVYDAVRFQLLLCTQRRRNATWQVMH